MKIMSLLVALLAVSACGTKVEPPQVLPIELNTDKTELVFTEAGGTLEFTVVSQNNPDLSPWDDWYKLKKGTWSNSKVTVKCLGICKLFVSILVYSVELVVFCTEVFIKCCTELCRIDEVSVLNKLFKLPNLAIAIAERFKSCKCACIFALIGEVLAVGILDSVEVLPNLFKCPCIHLFV